MPNKPPTCSYCYYVLSIFEGPNSDITIIPVSTPIPLPLPHPCLKKKIKILPAPAVPWLSLLSSVYLHIPGHPSGQGRCTDAPRTSGLQNNEGWFFSIQILLAAACRVLILIFTSGKEDKVTTSEWSRHSGGKPWKHWLCSLPCKHWLCSLPQKHWLCSLPWKHWLCSLSTPFLWTLPETFMMTVSIVPLHLKRASGASSLTQKLSCLLLLQTAFKHYMYIHTTDLAVNFYIQK